MKDSHLILFLFVSLVVIPVSAQKKKTNVKTTPKTTVIAETPANKLFNSMLSATAKVMIIDSIVVDKNEFLSKIPLNEESGSVMTYNDFFHDNLHSEGSVYLNEFKNSCYFSKGDSAQNDPICSINLLGKEWSKPDAVSGITKDYVNPNYPFMMADGLTLFFAAKGEKSLGGYDLFMTLFDRDSGQFYTPENYGLPFNSDANDYMIAIDDLDTLGWFVSDRYQPNGKVCIYTFVPTELRQNFDGDNLSKGQLEKYAKIISIKDTWSWGDRDKAIARLQHMKERAVKKDKAENLQFVINDEVTYNDVNEFKSQNARKMFIELMNKKNDLLQAENYLSQLRDKYSKSDTLLKNDLKTEILQLEQNVEKSQLEIHQMEKATRNLEITYLAQ